MQVCGRTVKPEHSIHGGYPRPEIPCLCIICFSKCCVPILAIDDLDSKREFVQEQGDIVEPETTLRLQREGWVVSHVTMHSFESIGGEGAVCCLDSTQARDVVL